MVAGVWDKQQRLCGDAWDFVGLQRREILRRERRVYVGLEGQEKRIALALDSTNARRRFALDADGPRGIGGKSC